MNALQHFPTGRTIVGITPATVRVWQAFGGATPMLAPPRPATREPRPAASARRADPSYPTPAIRHRMDLEGLACPYGVRSTYPVNGRYEVFAPGAFDRADVRGCVLVVGHNPQRKYASVADGTLTVWPTAAGLRFCAELPSWEATIRGGFAPSSVRRRDAVNGMSFALPVGSESARCHLDDRGRPMRTIAAVPTVADVSVSVGAFPCFWETRDSLRLWDRASQKYLALEPLAAWQKRAAAELGIR